MRSGRPAHYRVYNIKGKFGAITMAIRHQAPLHRPPIMAPLGALPPPPYGRLPQDIFGTKKPLRLTAAAVNRNATFHTYTKGTVQAGTPMTVNEEDP